MIRVIFLPILYIFIQLKWEQFEDYCGKRNLMIIVSVVFITAKKSNCLFRLWLRQHRFGSTWIFIIVSCFLFIIIRSFRFARIVSFSFIASSLISLTSRFIVHVVFHSTSSLSFSTIFINFDIELMFCISLRIHHHESFQIIIHSSPILLFIIYFK